MTTACDVSEFQTGVTDSYPHRWLIFRCCDGDYLDHKVTANLAWAKRARAAGRLDGYTLYVVYRPGMNGAILNHLNGVGVPRDCHLMIDAETWGGQIGGNHSIELNALASSLASRQGNRSLVWGYANRGDYGSMWPNRPAWLGLVVASYGGSRPTSPGPGPLVGWQYTDGQWAVPGLPSSSPPFNRCDHNQLYVTATPAPPTPAPPPDIMEEIMAFYASKAAFEADIRAIVHDEIGKFAKLYDPATKTWDGGGHALQTVVARQIAASALAAEVAAIRAKVQA